MATSDGSIYHLGINLGHDRSAAIVKNGNIETAIQQERLDRTKNSIGFLHQSLGDCRNIQIPHEAIQYCLRKCDIGMNEVSTITANMPGIDYSIDILQRAFPKEVSAKIYGIPSHHLSHAYTAYWPSGFDEAIVLVADASGTTDRERLTESYSLYIAKGTEIKLLHSEKVKAYLAPLSTLGFVYEFITKLAGFSTAIGKNLAIPEAGKLMGLAPYGTYCDKWHEWLQAKPDSYSIDISAYDLFLEVEALKKLYDDGKGKAYLRPYIVDLAYKIQSELEEALLHIVELAIKQTNCRKLCCAGGVALNSVANYTLLTELNLEDIFVFPAAGDAGIAVGNAFWAYHNIEKGNVRCKLEKATLGRDYTETEIEAAIHKFANEITVEKLSYPEMVSTCAVQMSKGNIIARFEGGSEFGPRALGHRSIIADPTFKKMKDILNYRVKFREAFRPFAPVIPWEEISTIFEQAVASPFMLLVSNIKKEYHDQIPSVTHHDGTGRVQTVTKENTFFYDLCHKMVKERGGCPVILNTSFNIAGQPIIETPEEAISTFLSTDIDFLSLEGYWIRKKNSLVLSYEEHLAQLQESDYPHGLTEERIDVTHLMNQLDEAIFFGKTENLMWTRNELERISSQGAIYKETSVFFAKSPLGKHFSAQLEKDLLLLLDPLGMSEIKDLSGLIPAKFFTYEEVRLLMLCYKGTDDELEELRLELNLSEKVFREKLEWAAKQLKRYNLTDKTFRRKSDSINVPTDITLGQFGNEAFSLYNTLKQFSDSLTIHGYSESNICKLLAIETLQSIEPTYIHYYSNHKLGAGKLEDLIRLFLLRHSLSKERMIDILGDYCFQTLCTIGIIIPREELFASRVDIYCIHEFFIATDHRYMIYEEEDHIEESPVMYIGMDSLGLVHTVPKYLSENILDLCTGSGIQAITASCYGKKVIGIDINPRAIRFARFNAQLNGVSNVRFVEGNLYTPIGNEKFDTILANPPFVPSPNSNLNFRDGGNNGEKILEAIITNADLHLNNTGSLFIVSDLVNVHQYEEKLNKWWGTAKADKLILTTADRNDILFSVPHCHYPFKQTFEQYNDELDMWIQNFNSSGISSVNFGYILIKKEGNSFYSKSIYNPTQAINKKVKEYFEQIDRLNSVEWDKLYLQLSDDINIKIDYSFNSNNKKFFLYSKNQFYSEYLIDEDVYKVLEMIVEEEPVLAALAYKDCVIDLIYKGIIKVKLQKRQQKYIDFYKSKEIAATLSNCANPEKDESIQIIEFQTKTTPTCLTSYIKQ
ncbi:MAG TPA: carbamoyltransferase C-terminal domain-containing protein [Methylomusa anaerophila]|uniref:Decarbamoylnovobiocin carbamoyltransferase n=1 Tax=Methylomusa anaerophila TaxID=1930071 RepID=A0A348AII7_9FIRM|nr:carbamoyltransferase C-terminal domain-containing protein [Methylomusa anaerophila]BBB90885.1 decarbamoylnovobiocin carbamoyltransferase [Methylomusa anaerophila]HML90604.1 carbamoyltransferase C-terminal domain-containing protein [Methylomusa anaerophila]